MSADVAGCHFFSRSFKFASADEDIPMWNPYTCAAELCVDNHATGRMLLTSV